MKASKEQTHEACIAMLIQEYNCKTYTEFAMMCFGNSYPVDMAINNKKYLQLLQKHNLNAKT